MAEEDANPLVSMHVSVPYRRRGQTTIWDQGTPRGPMEPGVEEAWRDFGAWAGDTDGKTSWIEVGLEVEADADTDAIIWKAVRMADVCFRENHPGADVAP